MPERPIDPDLVDVLEGREEDLLLRLNTALPCRVQRYDAALQVVDAVPLVRGPVPRAEGTYDHEDLPVVPSVPVVWPRVGAWGLSMALAEGDTGLLVCLESDLGTWRAGDGSLVDPVDLRRHHLSHAVFVPGLYVRSRALSAAASGTAAVVLGHDTSGARVTFRADGSVEITTATGTPLLLQGGTQPYVNGTLYADALGVFLTALGVFVTATGAAVAALGVFCAAVAAIPALSAALAAPASTLASALTAFASAVTTFGSAITTLSGGRAGYLSTRIRGS